MSLSISQVTFDCKDPVLLLDFWSQVFGYSQELWGEDIGGMIYSPDDTGTKMFFLVVPEQKTVKNRVHLDLKTADSTREAEVERLVKLGATKVEDKSLTTPEWSLTWTIMRDPEQNEFCVSGLPIPP